MSFNDELYERHRQAGLKIAKDSFGIAGDWTEGFAEGFATAMYAKEIKNASAGD